MLHFSYQAQVFSLFRLIMYLDVEELMKLFQSSIIKFTALQNHCVNAIKTADTEGARETKPKKKNAMVAAVF